MPLEAELPPALAEAVPGELCFPGGLLRVALVAERLQVRQSVIVGIGNVVDLQAHSASTLDAPVTVAILYEPY